MWLLQKQRRDSQCNGIGLCRILSTGKTSVQSIYRGTHRVGNSAVSPRKYFRLAVSQSPSKIWRAVAAGKIATRRLISRIILESVVNASSRRRRGLVFSDPGHRLRGSASPVLTATHHSYGSPRLSDFFSISALGVSPINGHSRKMAQTTCFHARMCLLQ